jgi:hypothetical protein
MGEEGKTPLRLLRPIETKWSSMALCVSGPSAEAIKARWYGVLRHRRRENWTILEDRLKEEVGSALSFSNSSFSLTRPSAFNRFEKNDDYTNANFLVSL